MGICLPPTIFLLFLLKDFGKAGAVQSFFVALRKSLPFFAVLIAYIIVRTFALGTISGGYQGSIGEGLSGSLAKRWLYDGSFLRVLFPLNLDVFGHNHSLYKELKLLYLLAAINVPLAFYGARRRVPLLKLFVFGLGWLVFSLLPTYQVWNLTETLQGSRFVYFATVPLAFLLALMTVPPVTAAGAGIGRVLQLLRLALLTAFIIALATITGKDNGPWQHAMKELKTFQEAICRQADADEAANIILLNIPESYRGAHMLYNGATMSVMLVPPLAKKDITDRVFTFEPATYGDADLINVSRLRRLRQNSGGKNHFYIWKRDQLKLAPIDQIINVTGSNQTKAETILFESNSNQAPLVLAPDKIILSPPVNQSALTIDALAVDLSATSLAKLKAESNTEAKQKSAVLDLSWPGGQYGFAGFEQYSEWPHYFPTF